MHIKMNGSSVMPFLFGTLLLFVGCDTTMQFYEGPKQPLENVAHIKAHFGMFDQIRILEIDGKALGRTDTSAWILPGAHTVTVLIENIGYLGSLGPQNIDRKALSFQALAGHTYVVNSTMKHYEDTYAWIMDKTTKEVVAGERP